MRDFDCRDVRRLVLSLGIAVGSLFLEVSTGDRQTQSRRCRDVLEHLHDISVFLGFSIMNVVDLKLSVNEQRYPSQSCLDLSAETEIPKSRVKVSGDTLVSAKYLIGSAFINKREADELDSTYVDRNWTVYLRSRAFVVARGWQYFDDGLSLSLAIGSEYGELADVVSFKKDITHVDIEAYGSFLEECADIYIFTLRLLAGVVQRDEQSFRAAVKFS